jgi:hypothetical protein
MLDSVAAEFVTGAVLCPHPAERQFQTVYVRDPESGASMGLCAACRVTFSGLAERRVELVAAGEHGRDEVYATLLAHGYTEADAAQFWSDLQKREEEPTS